MMKKIQQTTLAIALSVVLTGCGGSKSSDSSTAPSAGPQTPQEKMTTLEGTGAIPDLERFPTIAGIDLNANGVRDDVERYIEDKYTVEAQRRAAMQAARALQAKLTVDLTSKLALDAASEMGNRAGNCLYDVFPGEGGNVYAPQVSLELESITTNTKERLKAYLAYNKSRSGSVTTLSKGDTCE